MLRKPTDQLIIKPRLSSTVRLALAVVGILVVVGASIAGYWGGREAVQVQLESRASEIETLEERLRESRERRQTLEAELSASTEKLASLRQKLETTQSSLNKVTRQLQIDQSAYQELRSQLLESNSRITELASELKFYRSIISPADGESGVRIQELRLEGADAGREYRYRLVLIQALEHEDVVRGSVRFEITGTEEGSSRTIHSPGDDGASITAEFRYFQNLAGTLELPNGFMPAEIRVIFESESKGVVERVFPWPGSVGGRNA